MLRLPDPLDHFACALRIGAPDFRLLRLAKRLFRRQACQGRPHPADFQRVTIHLDAEFGEQPFGDPTDRHPDRRFSRAGLLQHVPDIAMVVLDGPDEIGMARAWTGDDLFQDRGTRLRGHDLFPVLPVPIGDMQGDGSAEGHPFADAREELDAVLLDAHAAAPAVAFLASGEVAIDVVGGERHACGHPFQDGDQTLPVEFLVALISRRTVLAWGITWGVTFKVKVASTNVVCVPCSEVVWKGTWLPCSIFAGLLSRVMILGAETILVWARASPAESRRSSVPVVPKNLPMRIPAVVPGMVTPVPEAGKFTRKSAACV